MARKTPCPFCGPKPIKAREEFEVLKGAAARNAFMASICDRCWGAIIGEYDPKPVNEAESSQEAYA